MGAGYRRDAKNKVIKGTHKEKVTRHVFAETTYVVTAPPEFACMVRPRHSYIFYVSS